jgi:hypothetical protein
VAGIGVNPKRCQPVNMQLAAYYNIVRPIGGADWQLRAQVQFLFPK